MFKYIKPDLVDILPFQPWNLFWLKSVSDCILPPLDRNIYILPCVVFKKYAHFGMHTFSFIAEMFVYTPRPDCTAAWSCGDRSFLAHSAKDRSVQDALASHITDLGVGCLIGAPPQSLLRCTSHLHTLYETSWSLLRLGRNFWPNLPVGVFEERLVGCLLPIPYWCIPVGIVGII